MTDYLVHYRITQGKMIVQADDSWEAGDVARDALSRLLEDLYEPPFVEIVSPDPEPIDYGPCIRCGQPLDAHGDGLGQISQAGCARVAALPPEARR
jgi:hypothetical protein